MVIAVAGPVADAPRKRQPGALPHEHVSLFAFVAYAA
jgi:hypothetical protein